MMNVNISILMLGGKMMKILMKPAARADALVWSAASISKMRLLSPSLYAAPMKICLTRCTSSDLGRNIWWMRWTFAWGDAVDEYMPWHLPLRPQIIALIHRISHYSNDAAVRYFIVWLYQPYIMMHWAMKHRLKRDRSQYRSSKNHESINTKLGLDFLL